MTGDGKSQDMERSVLLTPTGRFGLTPLGMLAVIGLSGYALASTVFLGTCLVQQPFAACEGERRSWGYEMVRVGLGFGLLFTASPGSQLAAGGLALLAGGGRRDPRMGDDESAAPSLAEVVSPELLWQIGEVSRSAGQVLQAEHLWPEREDVR